MQELPLFLNLSAKPCLLIGGGDGARHKLNLLLEAKANVTVVSLEFSLSFQQYVDNYFEGYVDNKITAENKDNKISSSYNNQNSNGQIRLIKESFCLRKIASEQYFLIVDASESLVINEQLHQWAQANNQLLNVVDRLGFGNASFGSIIDRTPLTIAISSGGKAPMLARQIREKIEAFISPKYGDLAALVQKFRYRVNKQLPELKERRRFWDNHLHGHVGELIFNGRQVKAETFLTQSINGLENNQQIKRGEVFLVGSGPGNPDLVTIRGLRLMQQADIVIYDRLICDDILRLVRREAEQIQVGKNRNKYGITKRNVTEKLISLANQGLNVLRLKEGDPFMFGNGGEELELLAANDVDFQIVPGISAASGCASYAGIPLTHKDIAQSVRFITGHKRDDKLNLNWAELVKERQTLVFFMGLNGLEMICSQLIAFGMAAQTPAALIERGTMPNQRLFIATIADLAEKVRSENAQAPTLIIVGKVVDLHQKLNWFGN